MKSIKRNQETAPSMQNINHPDLSRKVNQKLLDQLFLLRTMACLRIRPHVLVLIVHTLINVQIEKAHSQNLSATNLNNAYNQCNVQCGKYL